MDARRHAPATDRNREPILDVLAPLVAHGGFVLEIASGTGQHAAFFAAKLPGCTWQPSDADPSARESIAAWTKDTPNVRPPIELDVTRRPWPIERADLVVCINMIHIAPWEACESLLAGASAIAPLLLLYGPYRRGGAHTAPSNEAFDRRLREENPAWGVRDLEEVVRAAQAHGLALERVVGMPANNHSVIFRNET